MSAPDIPAPASRRHRWLWLRVALLPALVATAALGYLWSLGAPLPAGARADFILVEKGARRLTLMRNGAALKTYAIALGNRPSGAKRVQGDGRTPEGRYVIDWRNPESCCHLSLHISYPGAADRARARALGASPGGDIMIHGLRNGMGWLGPLHRLTDWTSGCIAVTNEEMEEIWRAVPNGTPIEIRG